MFHHLLYIEPMSIFYTKTYILLGGLHMNIIYLKNFLKTMGLCLTLFLLITLLATTLNFFNIITTNTMNLFKMIIPVITILISGIYLGNKAKSKGWKEGLKLSIVIIILLLLIHLIWMRNTFGIKNIFYYSILMISSMVGSIIGINIKRKN